MNRNGQSIRCPLRLWEFLKQLLLAQGEGPEQQREEVLLPLEIVPERLQRAAKVVVHLNNEFQHQLSLRNLRVMMTHYPTLQN